MMKSLILALFCGAAMLLPAAEEVVYRNDFNSPGLDRRVATSVRTCVSTRRAGIDNSGCIVVTNAKEEDSSLAGIPLDVEKLRGRAVMAEGWMKAENVTRPKLSYLGPKLMLGITYNDGRKDHPDQEKVIGSYDWRKFTVFARIPHSAKSVDLCIGLQGCARKNQHRQSESRPAPGSGHSEGRAQAAAAGPEGDEIPRRHVGGDLSPPPSGS